MLYRIKYLTVALILAILAIVVSASAQDPLARYNVIWDSPSEDFKGSMPIGNGDIGANVWVEQGGDLLFYIGKTDSYSENVRLLKLGKLRVSFSPNPFEEGCNYEQELDLRNGMINIRSAGNSPEISLDLQFWVDANNPVIRISGKLSVETTIDVKLEHWRTEREEASVADRSFSGLLDRDSEDRGFAYPVYVEADSIVKGRRSSIVWYHRNRRGEHSIWEETLRVQRLEGFMDESSDPLRGLIFGALVEGEGLVSASPVHLQSAEPGNSIDISVFPLTEQTATAAYWIEEVESRAQDYKKKPGKQVLDAHKQWWNHFWDRSWIYPDSNRSDDAFSVGRGYVLQNWITACGGRGNRPIRFNGSIFTVDGIQPNNGINYGPDYRAWGSAYWWQNTRLPYWAMAVAGNYDMMKPLFNMYMEALPLARSRIKEYYGFEGAYFPETMYFWGAYRNEDFGWHPEAGREADIIRGHHIRYEWQGGIELTAMMLQYYHHTLDRDFLRDTLLPFARQITMFYDHRYARNEDGKLVIYPANALEDIFLCTNPTPEVAGLRYILPQLAELAGNEQDRAFYTRLLGEIPELESDVSSTGQSYILPAREAEKRRNNCEKPECYALFPYRLYGVGLPDLEVAKETFRLSPKAMKGNPRDNGWVQDPILAACVGDVAGASERMVARSQHIHKESRFPGFWDATFAWVPNQDHGGVNMIALQHMLLQTEPWSDRIHLCPAWPKEWDCSFKLHAPGKTIIEGEIKNGRLSGLKVTPESRRNDIVNHWE